MLLSKVRSSVFISSGHKHFWILDDVINNGFWWQLQGNSFTTLIFFLLSFLVVFITEFISADCRKWLPPKKLFNFYSRPFFFVLVWPQPITRDDTDIKKWVSPRLFREVSSLILTPYLFKRSNTSFSCMRSSYVKDDTISTQSEDEWHEEQYRSRYYPIILSHCQGKKRYQWTRKWRQDPYD